MKKILLLIALAALLQPVFGADRAPEILDKLAAGFRTMPGYRVNFEVRVDGQNTGGYYTVSGESYYMRLGDAEIYCDGRIRREIDNRRKEITITEVEQGSRNILDNPVHAFDFLGSQYSSTLLWERDGKAAVRLTPASGNESPAGDVTVIVETAVMRPQSLTYEFDGQRIEIAVMAVAPLKTPLKAFDKAAYGGYEEIDFR